MVQGIRWCFHCCRPSSVSDWGTKIPQAVHGQKKKKKKMLWGILWFSGLYPGSFRWTPCPSQFSAWTNQELGCSVKITGSPRHPQGLQLGAQLFPPDHAVRVSGAQACTPQSPHTSSEPTHPQPRAKPEGQVRLIPSKCVHLSLQLTGFPLVIWQVFTTF